MHGMRSAGSFRVTTVETVVVWRLRSKQTSATVTCVIEEYDSGHCLIRVTHAESEVLSSWHVSREDAATRATGIETDLLQAGWAT